MKRILATLAMLAVVAITPHPDSVIVRQYTVTRAATVMEPFAVHIDSTWFTTVTTFDHGVVTQDTTWGRP